MKKFALKQWHYMIVLYVTINLIKMKNHVTLLYLFKILNMKLQMYADRFGCKVHSTKEI